MQERLKGFAGATLGLLSGFLCFTGTLDAAPVTFEFTGLVTRYVFADGDPLDPFGGTVSEGTVVTGQYTFESGVPDTAPATNVGRYDHSGSGFAFSVNVGGNQLQDNLEEIFVWFDNALGSAEGYQVSSEAYFTTQPGFLLTLDNDTAAGAIASDDLPLFPMDLGNFTTSALVISQNFVPGGEMLPTGVDFLIESELQTLTLVVPVPLPKSLVLLLSGLGVISFTCAKKKQRNPGQRRCGEPVHRLIDQPGRLQQPGRVGTSYAPRHPNEPA